MFSTTYILLWMCCETCKKQRNIRNNVICRNATTGTFFQWAWVGPGTKFLVSLLTMTLELGINIPDSKQTLIQRRFVVVTVSIGHQSNLDVESTFIIWSVHQNVITPKIKHWFNVEITLAYQPTQPTHLIEIITSDTGWNLVRGIGDLQACNCTRVTKMHFY